MDRSVLEGDPHSVIEAMAIAAYSIGSAQGYVYVRAEYPLAIERLTKALDQAREYGLLGDNIMGTDFCFDLEIRMGSGAFVCGEETALMTSIEGKRGEPRPRPPFPAQKGLWGKPSLLNNVETYACVPWIFRNGPEKFAAVGTPRSKGTKVFALAGKVARGDMGLMATPVVSHADLRGFCLQSDGKTLAWVQNRFYTWYEAGHQGKTPPTISGAEIAVPVKKDGTYRVELWDTRSGKVISNTTTRSAAQTVKCVLPPVEKDVALKAIHVGSATP